MGKFRRFALSFLLLQGLTTTALAMDEEPNDTCPGQSLGAPPLPLTVAGSLDTPPDVADVDFFRLELTPGVELVADLRGASTGAGTLEDPLLGLFDSGCRLVGVNDDNDDGTLDSRLIFVVPADGVVVLAATGYADSQFAGNGFGAGSYTLTLADAPPLVGSISARLVDGHDGHPLSGDEPTIAEVELLRCEGSDGSECRDMGLQAVDAEGRFTFGGEPFGLRAGNYQIAAAAIGYEHDQVRFSDVFEVSGGEDFDFGDLALEPNELRIGAVRRCRPTPIDGGVCTFAFDLHNRDDSPFSGRVWSLVSYYLPGGEFNYAFQIGSGNAQTPQPIYVWLAPEQSRRVVFHLRIPPVWPALDDGGFACVSAGVGEAPFAVYNLVTAVDIGCLSRDPNGFDMAPARTMNRLLKAQGRGVSGSKGLRVEAGKQRPR